MNETLAAPVLSPPLVSVVVPVYNGARYLRESLDSLLAQTYGNLEILVIDDASTDETPAIIASYGKAIRGFRQTANCGTFESANLGIGLARGEFIAIYHADDIYDPRIVEREVDFLAAHPEAGAVFCLDRFVDAENREYGQLVFPPEFRGRREVGFAEVLGGLLRYKNSFLRCPGAMVRAAVYREVGLYRQSEFGIAADLEMWLRIARGHSLGLLEEHLFRYRHFHGNWTQRYNYLRIVPEEFFVVMDRYLDSGARALASRSALEAYEGHREEDRLRLAVSHYIRGDLAAARSELARIRAKRILLGNTLRRGDLLVVLVSFRALVRLPRIGPVADVFLGRWFIKRPPRRPR